MVGDFLSKRRECLLARLHCHNGALEGRCVGMVGGGGERSLESELEDCSLLLSPHFHLPLEALRSLLYHTRGPITRGQGTRLSL